MSLLTPTLHYRRPRWTNIFHIPTFLVCAMLSDLAVTLALDNNLHPGSTTRTVAVSTGHLLDAILPLVGPPLVIILLLVGVFTGSFGDLALGLLGALVGAVLIAYTIGFDAVGLYVVLIVVLRILVIVVQELLLVWPVRLLILLGLVFWTVTR